MCITAHVHQFTASVHIKPETKQNDDETLKQNRNDETLKQCNQNGLVYLKENASSISKNRPLRTYSERLVPA
jgi:hypothetical protein